MSNIEIKTKMWIMKPCQSNRQLAMIHPVDEPSLMQEIGEIASAANVHYSLMVDM